MRLKLTNPYHLISFTFTEYPFLRHFGLKCWLSCYIFIFLPLEEVYLFWLLYFIICLDNFTSYLLLRSAKTTLYYYFGWVILSNSVLTWRLTIKTPSAFSACSSNIVWKYQNVMQPLSLPSSYQPVLLTRYIHTDDMTREFTIRGWERTKAQCLLWFSSVAENRLALSHVKTWPVESIICESDGKNQRHRCSRWQNTSMPRGGGWKKKGPALFFFFSPPENQRLARQCHWVVLKSPPDPHILLRPHWLAELLYRQLHL